MMLAIFSSDYDAYRIPKSLFGSIYFMAVGESEQRRDLKVMGP